MQANELIDVDTWAQLRKAAPKVTAVPFDAAQAGVRALGTWLRTRKANSDLDGRKYWEATLKDLIAVSELAITPAAMGRIVRTMGLVTWREFDGYHAAWSEEQFRILKKYFKV